MTALDRAITGVADIDRFTLFDCQNDTVKALQDPEVKKRFAELGVEAVSSTPEQFAAFIRSETAKYSRLIKEANIKVE